ncbi:hypothetical protein [Lactobacillus helveticus]|nr:hypothetical protein [Lactobacillus helveticus]
MNRIKQLRNERNLTLVELGEQLNLPKDPFIVLLLSFLVATKVNAEIL